MINGITTKTIHTGVTRAAEKAGCSRSHLSKILRGHDRPGKKLAKRLRRAGVPLPETFGEVKQTTSHERN